MSPERFEEQARQALASPVRVGTYVVYPSKVDALLGGPDWFGDHPSYQAWETLLRYNRARLSGSGCIAVQEAIRVDRSLVIRRSESNCSTSVKVIEGRGDPLDASVDGVEVRLLAFGYTLPLASDDITQVDAFYVSPQPSEALARKLLDRVSIGTLTSDFAVVLRSDEFFMDGKFPALFAFGVRPAAPSVEAWLKSSMVRCTKWKDGKTGCLTQTGREYQTYR